MMHTAPNSTSASPVIPEIFLSGHCVPSGIYRDLFSGSEVVQSEDTCLPCQEDGSPSLYVRLARIASLRPAATQKVTQIFAPGEGKSGQ
jgi:hypothetical protein